MALRNKVTAGNRIIFPINTTPKKITAAYAALAIDADRPAGGPAVGDLIIQDASLGDAVGRCTSVQAPLGEVVSINSGNGTLSIAEYIPGVEVMFEYTGVVALGNKIKSFGVRATVGTSKRDQVQVDNINGIGAIIAIDSDTPGGTGFVVVRF